MYDEFQQRVYLEPELSEERLLDIFREVYESYGFEIYDGYEYEWADVIHNFQQPLYYISYAVSAIPALELYVQLVESPNEAMDTYLRVAGMVGRGILPHRRAARDRAFQFHEVSHRRCDCAGAGKKRRV